MLWNTDNAPPEEEAVEEPADDRRRPWWWRLGSFVIEMILVVALAAAIPTALSYALHTDYPLATITSSSMWPTLKRGDLVVVRGVGDGRIERGQIIVYRNTEDDTMIIHRVIDVDGADIITQGDANSEADEPITRSDVTGIVPTLGSTPLHIPYVGEIALAVNGEF